MPNNYSLITYHQNNTKKERLLTKKQLNEIEKRQLYALRLNNYNEISDAKQKVIKIIDEKGLDSEDDKVKLDSAFKVLPYIIPQKKAIDLQVTTKSIEQIIQETIPEAEVMEITTENTATNEDIKTSGDNQTQTTDKQGE